MSAKWWLRRTASVLIAALVFSASAASAPVQAGESPGITPSAAHVTLLSAADIAIVDRRGVLLRLRATDASNDRGLSDTRVHAQICSGDATFDGSNSVEGSTDAFGIIALHIVPGSVAGPLLVRVTIASAAQDIKLHLVRVPEKPFVVGVATVGVGAVPGLIESPDSGPNGTLARRGSASIYASGTVAQNTRATVAYRSADTLEQSTARGPFIDNPDDRPFPTYGDSSTRSADALSRNHFFGRVENATSSAMWGEFYARGGTPEAAGGYDVLVNGARLETQGSRVAAGAFSARDNVAFDRAVLSPTGLGIADRVLQPAIIVGSDIVTLVSLDRRSGAVMAQHLLGRGTDYVLDYASGLLRFINILLPYDEFFNPQVVVVQYQYGGAAAHASMFGANGSLRFSPAADAPRVDSWYLNDSTGSGALAIFGQALHGGSPGAFWSLSHERSAGLAPLSTVQYGTAGDRYRADLGAHGSALSYDVHFDSTAAGYTNPYGAFASPGLSSLDAGLQQRLSRIASAEVKYVTSKNGLPASAAAAAVSNADSHGRIGLRVTPSARLTYHVAVVAGAANGNGVVAPVTSFGTEAGVRMPGGDLLTFPSNTSTVAYAPGAGHGTLLDTGIRWTFVRSATLSLDERSGLSHTSDPYDPPRTDAALEIATGPTGKAFLRQRWQRSPSDVLAASQQFAGAAATATSSTTAGLEQQFGPTTVETGYAVDRTANGTDLYEAIGARRSISFGHGLTGDAFAQTGRALLSTALAGQAADSPNFLVFGTAITYAEKAFSASGQLQTRTGFNSGSTYALGAAGPVSASVALFASISASRTQSVDTSTVRAGISYRPANNDRSATLFSIDTQSGNLTNYNAYVTNVAQLQELYRISRRTELGASLAYKITGDTTFAPRTIVFGVRADQRIGPRFDLGAELHRSDSAPLDGAQATGIALESGYRVGAGLRIAGGYNFSGFADAAAAVSPTHRGVYATVSTYVDRIFGWGK